MIVYEHDTDGFFIGHGFFPEAEELLT
jgi:hypothetical protein